MKEIPLTKGQFALVDDEDYDWLMQWKWHSTTYGHPSRTEYINGKQTGRCIWMHKEIMKASEDVCVDHIDGNPYNNQKSNLRICNHGQNMFNKRSYTGSTSKYKGVSWKTQQGKWVVQIQKNHKKYHGGYYNTEEDAAIAYNELAKQLFGEFARLNVIDGR